MKTNKIFRIAAILLMAVVLTTCVIGSTFAKYTNVVNATADSATVATWDVQITTDGSTDVESFDLFATIKDSNGTTEEDVANDKIAPGTSGEFQFKIKNASEVTAKCTVTLNVTNNNIPIEFSFDGVNYNKSNTEYSVENLAAESAAATTVTVKWRWAFTGNDGDTDLGTAGTATVTVGATITAEQVD